MRLCFVCFGVGCCSDLFGCLVANIAVAGYARSQGRTPVSFGPTDLVCCRTLQGHTGKVLDIRVNISCVCLNVNVFSFLIVLVGFPSVAQL